MWIPKWQKTPDSVSQIHSNTILIPYVVEEALVGTLRAIAGIENVLCRKGKLIQLLLWFETLLLMRRHCGL